MVLRRSIAFVASLAAILFLVLSIQHSSAQNGSDTGSGLQISPTRTEISSSSGETKSFSLTVKNITQGNLTAKAILNDFESDDATGTPKIVIDTSQRTPYSLSKMLQGLQDLELKPGEVKEVKLTLNVPGDVSPGAYFGAIRYQVVPKTGTDAERQVALSASVAHLVFLEVPGQINEQIQIQSLKFQRGAKSSSFFIKAPDKASLAIKNLGNGFSRPFGSVTINYNGKKVHSYEVNNTDPRGIVLPNSSRTFTDGLSNIKKPGKYSAIVGVAYGSGSEVITYKSSFWYVPLWCIIVLLVLLVLIAVGIRYIYQKRFSTKQAKKSPLRSKKK